MIIVQEGIHSQGCGGERTYGLVSEPFTGHIDRQLSHVEVVAEWCLPTQRRNFGYCYESGL